MHFFRYYNVLSSKKSVHISSIQHLQHGYSTYMSPSPWSLVRYIVAHTLGRWPNLSSRFSPAGNRYICSCPSYIYRNSSASEGEYGAYPSENSTDSLVSFLPSTSQHLDPCCKVFPYMVSMDFLFTIFQCSLPNSMTYCSESYKHSEVLKKIVFIGLGLISA
jgi:hypothetical protein